MAVTATPKASKAAKSGVSERIVHKPTANAVRVGDVMMFVYFAKVKDITNGGDTLTVTNLDAGVPEIKVQGKALVENGASADQFKETQIVSKTKAAELLVSSYNRPLTVVFEKADGSERTLRGRLVQPEPLLGRSMCEDLDIADTDRLRLVDHRTLKSLIVDGVKYTVKS